MDEIQARIGLRPTPLTWPVGIAGDFKGVLDRRTGQLHPVHPHRGRRHGRPRGAHVRRTRRTLAAGVDWDRARRGVRTARGRTAPTTTGERSSAAQSTPVLFTSAVLNFGVNQLLDVLVEIAPPPSGALDVDGAPA